MNSSELERRILSIKPPIHFGREGGRELVHLVVGAAAVL